MPVEELLAMSAKRRNIDVLFSHSGSEYKVKVQNQDGGGDRGGNFSVAVKEITDDISELRLARSREASREIDLESIDFDSGKSKIRKLGGKFFKGLSSYLESFLPRADDKYQVRLRFKFNEDVPELSNWPWEYLYDHAHMSLQGHTPIVRYIEYEQRSRSIEIETPLKILFVAANFPKYRKLDLKRELEGIQKTLNRFSGKVEWDILPEEEATKKNFQNKLTESTYHVLHFMGHGTFDNNENQGFLQLSDGPLEDSILKTWVANHKTLRMVFLNACRGAQSDNKDLFTGMAHNIVEVGVPAVIAMQFAVSDEAAINFSKTFYENIIEKNTDLEDAVTAGRLVLQRELKTSLEWGTPVLFLRSDDTTIFTVSENPDNGSKKIEKTLPNRKVSRGNPNMDFLDLLNEEELELGFLIKEFKSLPSMSTTQKRKMVFNFLPDNIKDSINSDDLEGAVNDTVPYFVQTCYGRSNGIKELVRVIKEFDKGTKAFDRFIEKLRGKVM